MPVIVVKTIVQLETGLYVSAYQWHDPIWACRHRDTIKGHDWRWIGGAGWFGDERNKRLYEQLLEHVSDLADFRDWEYELLDQPVSLSTEEDMTEAPTPTATATTIDQLVQPGDIDFELARQSYSNISHDPERRAQGDQQAYVDEMRTLYASLLRLVGNNDELHVILMEELTRYKQGYLRHYAGIRAARSQTASSMITGPSNFPTARNQKKLNTEHKRIEEMDEWRTHARAAIRRTLKNNQPADMRVDREWEPLQRKIERDLNTIEEIDMGRSHYNRSAFVNSIAGKIERLAANGEVELVDRAIDLVKLYNANHTKDAITARHKFWKLPDVAEKAREARTVQASADPNLIGEFDGGSVIQNPGLDRVQILFDARPGDDMRRKLNGAGWNFSRRQTDETGKSVWQRKLTNNAIYSAKQIVGLPLQ